jgi:hypothetical protein
MDGPKLEVADIFRRYGEAYRQNGGESLSTAQRRVMTAIEACRTAALGGHLERCDSCGLRAPLLRQLPQPALSQVPVAGTRGMGRKTVSADSGDALFSCRLHAPRTDRGHCLPEQTARLRHSVPSRSRDLVHHRRRSQTSGSRDRLFRCPATWGQNLLHHPHLHCVVPGGGISPDGTHWISCRPRFFLPIRVLSCLFRRLFLQHLKSAFDAGKLRFFSSLEALGDPQVFRRHLGRVRNVKWVVYAKPPFAGPQQVVGLHRALHAPRGDFQPSDRGYRKRAG